MRLEFPRNKSDDFLFCSGGCGQKAKSDAHASCTCGKCNARSRADDPSFVECKDWHPPLVKPYHPDNSVEVLEPGWTKRTCNHCGKQWEQHG